MIDTKKITNEVNPFNIRDINTLSAIITLLKIENINNTIISHIIDIIF